MNQIELGTVNDVIKKKICFGGFLSRKKRYLMDAWDPPLSFFL